MSTQIVQTITIFGNRKPTAYGLLQLGEGLLENTLRKASVMFTKTCLTQQIFQMSDANYIFMQSSALDYVIDQFGLPYDPQNIRNCFKYYFNIGG